MTKCSARIFKEFKRSKAESRHPVMGNEWPGLPLCGGLVTFSLSVTSGCCCHDSSELEVTMTCSRCKSPYFPGSQAFAYSSLEVIEELLNTTSQDRT